MLTYNPPPDDVDRLVVCWVAGTHDGGKLWPDGLVTTYPWSPLAWDNIGLTVCEPPKERKPLPLEIHAAMAQVVRTVPGVQVTHERWERPRFVPWSDLSLAPTFPLPERQAVRVGGFVSNPAQGGER